MGLVGLFTGIYCFIRTDTLNIFHNAQEAYEMQEYLVLFFPLFLTMYFERNFHTIYPRRFSTLLWGMIFNAVGQILLQSLGMCPWRICPRWRGWTGITHGCICRTWGCWNIP